MKRGGRDNHEKKGDSGIPLGVRTKREFLSKKKKGPQDGDLTEISEDWGGVLRERAKKRERHWKKGRRSLYLNAEGKKKIRREKSREKKKLRLFTKIS